MQISVLLAIVFCSCIVKSQDLPCKSPRPLGCPALVCTLMNSRKTDFCKDVHCEGISLEDCNSSNSTFERGLTMCGCCAGCASYLDVGDDCAVSPPEPTLNLTCTDPICPILKNRCKPGLVCNYLGGSTKKCALPDESSAGDATEEDKTLCEYKKNLGLVKALHWVPRCESDGTYSLKQCKGTSQDGTCFCVNAKGDRIFGREWWPKAENQTCACSRRVHDLRAAGNIAAFHCSYDGNYEPLQCDLDSGLCYCVEPQTGRLTGAVVPENKWKTLPCYSINVTGWDPTGQYLRKCESEWVAGQLISKEAALHGLHVLASKDYVCDYDGSHGPKMRIKSLEYCVDKMGGTASHFQEIDYDRNVPMTCQCYRDSLVYKEEGHSFLRVCDKATGNYAATAQSDPNNNNLYRCVDKHGFFFGNEVEFKYVKCCLEGDCDDSTESIKNDCFSATNGNGYRLCTSYPQ